MKTSSPPQAPLLVTAAILEREGKFLVTLRPAHKPHPHMWEFPGGKMEHEESPEQALQRELYEELAIDITVESVFDVVYHKYDWGPVLILAYRCNWVSGEIQHIEVEDHRWATADELTQLAILTADQPLIERLLQA